MAFEVENCPAGYEIRQLPWTFKFGDLAETTIVSPYCAPMDADTRIAFLPGVGERLPIVMNAVRHLGNAGLQVAGLEMPYPEEEQFKDQAREAYGYIAYSADEPPEMVENRKRVGRLINENIINGTLTGFLSAVVRDVNQRAGRDEDVPLDTLIGYSKGSGEVLLGTSLADQAGITLAHNVILVNPAGALSQHLGDKPRKYYKNAMHATIQQYESWRLSESLRPGYDVPVLTDLEETNRLNYAISRKDGPDIIRTLITERGYGVRVLSAENDLVCPPPAMRSQLGSLAHLVTEMPGHHASLCDPVGLDQLARAAQLAEELGPGQISQAA